MTKMRDECLLWLYKQLEIENAKRPPHMRIGLRRYLRDAGIMSPERQQIVDRREIPFSTLGFNEEYMGGHEAEDDE